MDGILSSVFLYTSSIEQETQFVYFLVTGGFIVFALYLGLTDKIQHSVKSDLQLNTYNILSHL